MALKRYDEAVAVCDRVFMEKKKLLSLRWPVNSLLLWNRLVTAGFKAAHYGSLTNPVLLTKILPYASLVFTLGSSSFVRGHAVAQLVQTLRYKSEGRGFDSRWCHWNFSLT